MVDVEQEDISKSTYRDEVDRRSTNLLGTTALASMLN